MKLPALLLVASLAANAALLFLYCGRGHPTPLPPPTSAAPTLNPQLSAPTDLPAGVPPNTWSALDTPDLRALVTRLRATGFAPHVIRALVEARINSEFDRRFRELEALHPRRAYWQPAPLPFSAGEPQRLEAYRSLANEKKHLLQNLLPGLDPAADARETKMLHRRFGELPAEKLARVKALHDDYTELRGQVTAGFSSITLPEDRSQIELLRRELRTDLAKLLSPAELADYERRASPFVYTQQGTITAMDATEAEFNAIADIHQKFAGEVFSARGSSAEAVLRRETVQAEIAAQLQTALGDTRYADYVRASHREYQRIIALGGNPPVAATVQAFDALNAAAQASARIVGDLTLSPEQQRAALMQLAGTAESQISAALGPAVASRYLKFSNSWLQDLRNGRAFAVTPDGLRTLPITPRKP